MIIRPITVAETTYFLRQAEGLWSDAERDKFVDYIASNPEVGDLIPGTGGVRKIRWSRQGSGKRGGVRVVYFYYDEGVPLYLLMIYAKSEKEDLDADEKHTLKTLSASLKKRHRN